MIKTSWQDEQIWWAGVTHKSIKNILWIRDLDLTLVKEAKILFLRHFETFLKRVVFFEAAGAIAKTKIKPANQVSLSKSLEHTVSKFLLFH